ncbi:MAG: bis(5'-nucleosyl)-tetraphosphatase [Oscillospiraceae bacterium]
MLREKSCGAVIYTIADGGPLFLIEKMQKGHFSLCKGHVEGTETEHGTARREIREETALEVAFVDGFRETIEYSPYEGCRKEVVFFLAQALSTDTAAQECEVAEIFWLPFDRAAETLTFESDRQVLTAARDFLARRG